MPLEIYGSFRSRARRVLWAALEAGVDFSHTPYAWNDPVLKADAFRAINPLGRVPATRDGNFVLSESLAINLYIAKHHAAHTEPALYPAGAENEAILWQWSFFAASDLDPWVVNFGDHTSWLPKDQRSEDIAGFTRAKLNRAIGYLDAALSDRQFLAADHFTIADLNVASVLQSLLHLDYRLQDTPYVAAWLDSALQRPAALKAKTLS